MISYNTLVVLLGVGLLGAGLGMIGTFAVLRRYALLGDALAHAALPGLCLAFMIFQIRSVPVLLCGALISGLGGILVVAALRRYTRIKDDAALGIVLSVFFGLGIVLSRLIQNHTTTGSKAGLDSYILGKTAGMLLQDVYLIGGLAFLGLVTVLLLFKEFQLTSFDPGFAHVQGWPTLRLDLLLMFLIALAVVIGLPAVGVVMVAALIVLPGAAARFWTDRLSLMLILSSLIGLATGIVGTFLSASAHGLPAGPVIALVGTGLFVLSAVFAPNRGLIGRFVRQRRFRHAADEARFYRLLHDYSVEQEGSISPTALKSSFSSQAVLHRLLQDAVDRGDLLRSETGFRVTPQGRELADEYARREQLWRLFLIEFPDLASQAQPLDGSRIEEVLPHAIVESLMAKLPSEIRLVGNRG